MRVFLEGLSELDLEEKKKKVCRNFTSNPSYADGGFLESH